jgi:DNA-binding CsgD family transcriptional regulator
VATDVERRRCRERIERLCTSTLDCESIQRESIADLRRVIGFDRWCWPSADPATLLPLAGVAEHDYGPSLPRALELEYSGRDVGAKDELACRAVPAGSLAVETGGDLASSLRWDEVMRPAGIGDVAASACRDALGCWGWIELYRNGDDRRFDDGDVELLARLGPSFAAVLRRGVAAGPTSRSTTPRGPGVLVLDRELRLVSWTAAARAWIEALPAARLFAAWGILPPVVYPAATRARAAAAAPAHALVPTADGSWAMIDAAPLEGASQASIAVTLRAATAAETFELVCRAWALSPRERELVALLAAGLDTRSLTRRLFISRHTVQDHLKSVFAKAGVHSRRELLARLNATGER